MNTANQHLEQQQHLERRHGLNIRALIELVLHYLLYIAIVTSLFLAVASVRADDSVRTDPVLLIQDTTDKLLTSLRSNRKLLSENPQYINELINSAVVEHFDFEKMSRLVLGKHWRKASTEQRQQFPEEFKALLVRTYATALLEYDNQDIRYLTSPASEARDEAIVKTEIMPRNASAIPVNYRLSRNGEHWKVYDITIDGISLVMTYRSTFASQIRLVGISGLIGKLARKNQHVASAE
ncbi:MAG: ABC transporter substrate-binding protein [Gammaproteobacteria bacterium]|nr:MAG: ABC transporter substrate-binding protein [Gammaproteobacteria bacterium]